MTLAWAIIIVTVLLLLDKHNMLRKSLQITVQVAIVVAVVGALILGAPFAWKWWQRHKAIRQAQSLNVCMSNKVPVKAEGCMDVDQAPESSEAFITTMAQWDEELVSEHKMKDNAPPPLTSEQNVAPAQMSVNLDDFYISKYPSSRSITAAEDEAICQWDAPVSKACQDLYVLPKGVSCIGKPYKTCMVNPPKSQQEQ